MSEVRVETDDIDFAAKLIDPVDRTAQGRRSDPAPAIGGGCRRSRLGVHELAGHDRLGAIQSSAANSDPGSSKTSLASAEVSR
jgi:hypothetical protein